MVLVLSFLIFVSVQSGSPEEGGLRYDVARIDSLLSAGIDLTLKQEYDGAQSVFRAMAEDFPDSPVGYLYLAAVLQSQALDYEELVPVPAFDSLLAVAREKSESVIARNPASPWGYFFLGTIFGNEALALAERGNWFGAVTRGMSSATNFERSVALDSQLVDAYTGIGTYYYWKSRKIEFLTWLPFISDNREEGITFLERCARYGVYNRFAAMSALINIYIDAAEYEKAVEMSRTALSTYPENRIFLWGLATALERARQPNLALVAYERLLRAIVNDPRPNRYNELVCRLNFLSLKLQTNRSENLREELSLIRLLAAGEFPEHLEDRVEDKRLRLKDLEKTLAGDGTR